MKKIEIKYFSDEIEKLRYIDGKSDWIDLRASEDVVLKKGEFKLIPLGIAMKLPEGYEAHVVPRSSTFKNFGVIMTNSVGIIDNSYCGDDDMWHFLELAIRDTEIHKNYRICQFRIMKNQPKIEFDEAIGKYNCYDTSLCLDAMINYNLKIGVIVRKDLVHYSVGKGILNQDFLKDEYSMRKKFNLPIPDNIKKILEK